MKYLIMTVSKTDKLRRFLVDRRSNPHVWWTRDIERTMVYLSKRTADVKRTQLKFRNTKTVTVREAQAMIAEDEPNVTKKTKTSI